MRAAWENEEHTAVLLDPPIHEHPMTGGRGGKLHIPHIRSYGCFFG